MQLFKIISTSLILLGIFAINGCNTVQGLGKDMQEGGQQIEKAASSNKN